MSLFSLVLLAGLLSPDCPATGADARTSAVFTRASSQDSVVRVAVCVATPAGRRVGSYHGELTFEQADARLIRVEKPADGMRVENTTIAGRVNFAAAVPSGLESGTLLVLVMKPAHPGVQPRVRLCMLELNDTRGGTMLPPDSCAHS